MSELKPIFIPDTHGRIDVFERLLVRLEQHQFLTGRRLVLLGDYVDGPQVPALLDRLIALQAEGHVCIAGNHDLMLRAMLTPGEHLTRWYKRWCLSYGRSWETLSGYGASATDIPSQAHDVPAFLQELLPAAHITFLGHLPLYWEQGRFIAVHAGLLPEQAHLYDHEVGVGVMAWPEQRRNLDSISQDTGLLFAGQGPSQVCQRELTSPKWDHLMPEGRCVVSGHQIQWDGVHFTPSRALLDRGACSSIGKLAAWIPDLDQLLEEPVTRR